MPGRKSRKVPIECDENLYGKRHRIKDALGRIEDRHRIAMRRDRRPTVFVSAIALAVTVPFRL